MSCYRSELFAERSRRSRVEEELASAREDNRLLRAEAAAARARRADSRRGEREFAGQLDAAAERAENSLCDAAVGGTSIIHDTRGNCVIVRAC